MGTFKPNVWLCLVATLGSSACHGSGSPPAGAVAVDSSGVIVVTNSAELMASVPRWTVAVEHRVELGSDASPETALSRVVDVLPRPRGEVVVATRQPPHGLGFTADGSVAATRGGEGEGPGEFSGMSSIAALPGDSIAVWDPEALRLSVFAADGRFARDVDLKAAVLPVDRAWSVLRRTPSGALAVFTVASFGAGRDVPLYRLSAESPVMDASGAVTGSLGPFPGVEMFNTEWGFGSAFFGAQSYAAVAGEDLVVGDGALPELRWYALDGTLERVARWPSGGRELTPAVLDSVKERVVAGAPEAHRAALRAQLKELPVPERRPALSDVLVSDVGEIWVGNYPGALAAKSMARFLERRWLVFSADGSLVAKATTPEGFQPYAVMGARVWGVFKDDLDVETVRAYAITRP